MGLLLALLLQAEDPRAKAVREAYEEQLKSERLLEVFMDQRALLETLAESETLTRSAAPAFLRLWIRGDFTIFVDGLDHPDPDVVLAAGRALQLLSGRKTALSPGGWKAWLAARKPPAACAHASDDVRRLLSDLAGDAVEARAAALAELRPCAARHRELLNAAAPEDVEAAARLRELRAAAELSAGTPKEADGAALKPAVALLEQGKRAEAVAALEAERTRFEGTSREALDTVLRALR